jgi:hypothetical protein
LQCHLSVVNIGACEGFFVVGVNNILLGLNLTR